MGDPGLPDNWGANVKCARCGGNRHESGTVECACPELDEKAAEECTDFEKAAAKAISLSDWRAAREAYEQAASVCEEREG